MSNYCAENERIKHTYFGWMRDAQQCSEATVDAAAKALSRFEAHTRQKNFRAFHHEQASAFKRHLAEQTSQRSGERLSKATLHATLTQLRSFFRWLADQPRYKSRFQRSDADYFRLPKKETQIATTEREKKSPTLEQTRQVIDAMPSGTEIERRNRALVAFALLTGARDSAIASFKLKHVDLKRGCVYQDGREVKTKFSKTFTTFFFPVSDGIREIVRDWVRFLREEKVWTDDDPLFPATRITVGETQQFEAAGLSREHWSNAEPIRKVFRESFKRAGLAYSNPHSLRRTLARLGEQVCETPEQFKAWSQNLGHELVLTTLTSYGSVATDRQGEIIRVLGETRKPKQTEAEDIAEAVFRKFQIAGASLPAAK